MDSSSSISENSIVNESFAETSEPSGSLPLAYDYSTVRVFLVKGEKGYGMKVSGDNPVFLQSVRDGGVAQKAGLRAGDKILQVNGIDVTNLAHNKVVDLILAKSEVSLTVLQRTPLSSSENQQTTSRGLSSSIANEPIIDEKMSKRSDTIQSSAISSSLTSCTIEPSEEHPKESIIPHINVKTSASALVAATNALFIKNEVDSYCPAPLPPKISLCRDGFQNYQQNIETKESIAGTSPDTPLPPFLISGTQTLKVPETQYPEFNFRKSPISYIVANNSPIRAANPQLAQRNIITMESSSDDEEYQTNQVEDHGPFSSLTELWKNLPHLAVFTNYILSNSNPNSILFYMLTDLYIEGSAKDMRKWAFEIHSCFLVPEAPMPLSNVDADIISEIDQLLTNEYDKPETLRNVFWRARERAEEELKNQLVEFQMKRVAGLGTLYGPTDQHLLEICQDKNKQITLYEKLFLQKLESYLDVLEKDNFDPAQYYTAAALATVLSRIFHMRPLHAFEKYPTFFSKEKRYLFQFLGSCTKNCPVIKKDKMKFKWLRQDGSIDARKHCAIFLNAERVHRELEEKNNFHHLENQDAHFNRSVSDTVSEEYNLQGTPGIRDLIHGSLCTLSNIQSYFETVSPTRKKSSNVNRSNSVQEQSEKRKIQRRNISDPSHSRRYNLKREARSGLSTPDSNSSFNCSSSSGRLFNDTQDNQTDSESGFESDIPLWQMLVSEDQRKELTPQEQTRQDIINELFSTENSHVRNLRVLYKIFYKQLKSSQQLKENELNLIFPNIQNLFEIHNHFNKKMKNRRNEQPIIREVGDIVLYMFDGDLGVELKRAAAKFCENQHIALQIIQDRRKKDTKFDDFLIQCEKKRHCRRLPFQGFLPVEVQRLSKYPLLLERLLTNGEVNDLFNKETIKLQRALEKSKEILDFVNNSIWEASNRHRLNEIQKHLDISHFKGDHPILKDAPFIGDLTSHKLIKEGAMLLKQPNKRTVSVHVLLMEEAVYILQKEGDKFLLKFFQGESFSNTLPLSPYIKTSLLLVRNNAACKNGLYLVNTDTNSSQIYDLVVEDDTQRDIWLQYFEKAIQNHYTKTNNYSSDFTMNEEEKPYDSPVEIDESMRTLIEQVKQKDIIIMQALKDKHSLVTKLLNKPMEETADNKNMVGSDNMNIRRTSDLAVAAIHQTGQLLELANKPLGISDNTNNTLMPLIPVPAIQSLLQPLSLQLNKLLSEVKQMEIERDALREEAAELRERLELKKPEAETSEN